MNRLTIDVEALGHNLRTVSGWVERHGASLTVVTKALCGHRETMRALFGLGVRSVADSRLSNIARYGDVARELEVWYLRPPHRSGLAEVVSRCHVSLNSELQIVRKLDEVAGRVGTTHKVVIMIELGDLREGVLPGTLVEVYRQIFDLRHVEVLGIGANLGCLSGALPAIDEFMQLVLYRELLELKFERELPLISAGTSAVLPLLTSGQLPAAINHFRVGETILLGSDPITGELFPGLRDVATFEAEVVELKEKRLNPVGEVAEMTPFASFETDDSIEPGQRGYRALIAAGQVDTEVASLRPLEEGHTIAGASSDITVVNVGDQPDGTRVGGVLRFRPGYAAFVRLMNNPETEKVIRWPEGDGTAGEGTEE